MTHGEHGVHGRVITSTRAGKRGRGKVGESGKERRGEKGGKVRERKREGEKISERGRR